MGLAYHFTGSTLRDGSSIPAIGEKLVFPGQIEICERGYHWSKRPWDALKYAPGNMLHLVKYGGETMDQHDKGCSSERTIIKTIDADFLCRRFAADQALSVAHLWQAPPVVLEYLTTLDPNLRDAAWGAARAAAGVAAWGAARDAAWGAARAAAWVAAWGAAWDAAWDAAGVAAGVAARDAAGDAARAAAWDAVGLEFDRRVYAAFEVEVVR